MEVEGPLGSLADTWDFLGALCLCFRGGMGLPPLPLSCPSLVSGQWQGPARGQSSAWHSASLFQFSDSFLSLTPTMLLAWFSKHSFSTSTVCVGREGTQ